MHHPCKYCGGGCPSYKHQHCRKCGNLLIQCQGFLRRYGRNNLLDPSPEEIIQQVLTDARIKLVEMKLDDKSSVRKA